MGISVERGGETSRYYSGGGSAEIQNYYYGGHQLVVRVKISGNNGGVTEIRCGFDPDTFEKLADVMMKVDSVAATRAFASALLQNSKEP
jgi:hypothetical protein